MQYSRPAKVDITQSGITVRDCENLKIVGDFPKSAIVVVTLVSISSCTFKIELHHCCDIGIQLKACNQEGLIEFTNSLKANDISLRNQQEVQAEVDSLVIPDLNDDAVQEFILKLLFCDEFKEFVLKLKTLLDGFEQEMNI